MTVKVAGKTYRYEDVSAEGEVSGRFHVVQEESVEVRGWLADGTDFGEYCGYVVWEEFSPHVAVFVGPDGKVDYR